MKKIKSFLKKIRSIRHLEYYLLALILAGGLLVRLYHIKWPLADWHSWRQADTAAVSRIYFDHGIDLLYPRYYDISSAQSGLYNPNGWRFVEFPIFNVFHVFIAKLLPMLPFDAAGRLVSIICALVTSFCLYSLGKRFIGSFGGLLAAFFYAFLPFNIYFTRVVLPEPMTAMFGTLALYFFIKFYDRNKFPDLIFTSVFFAAALLLKPYAFFYGVPIIIMMLQKYSPKVLVKNPKYYLVLALVIVPLIIWRLWVSRFPEGIPFWKWAFNGNHIRFKPSFWRWIFSERLGHLILGEWGLIPFAFSILAIKKGKEFIHYFLLGAFIYVSVVASANVMHDYYQTLIIPPIALALAYGINELWNSDFLNKIVSRILVVFSVLMMFGTTYYLIKDYYQINHPEIIEAGEKVAALTPPDALVVAPYNGDTAFLYQTKRFGWPVVDLPFNEILDKGADYYVSVNYDDLTNQLMQEYQVMEKTKNYVIINLHNKTQ